MNDHSLIDARTGQVIFVGSKEQCIKHVLNDSMAIVLHNNKVKTYQDLVGYEPTWDYDANDS